MTSFARRASVEAVTSFCTSAAQVSARRDPLRVLCSSGGTSAEIRSIVSTAEAVCRGGWRTPCGPVSP